VSAPRPLPEHIIVLLILGALIMIALVLWLAFAGA
jgi:hypothetical protein